jgi:glycerol-3-phosphate dehydrogenase (NAD(P)+)
VVVIGGGSYGTAVAIRLARAGVRTTLQVRTDAQAARLRKDRENREYLPGLRLPRSLAVETAGARLAGADYVLLAVPSRALPRVTTGIAPAGLGSGAAVVSMAKGLVGPDGLAATAILSDEFGAPRVASIGGPGHARELVDAGANLVVASVSGKLTRALAEMFVWAGLACGQSDDPLGVDLAAVAKNVAALAAATAEPHGLNVAGAAAGYIFAEVGQLAEAWDARPESIIGLAGVGDLLATALAKESRNRRAGALLAEGVPAAAIPGLIHQAVESLDSVPLLALALDRAGLDAPVTGALQKLIAGQLSVDRWVEVVRGTVAAPPRARRPRSRLQPVRPHPQRGALPPPPRYPGKEFTWPTTPVTFCSSATTPAATTCSGT